jgi:hypothetical protein
MHKNIILIFFLFIGHQSLHGQDSTISKFSNLFQQQYEFYSENVITHPLVQKKEYALVSLAYNLNQGDFIARQEPTRQKDVTFLTKGSRQLNSFKVSGMFSYNHSLRDSVGYTLGNHDQAAPYYFYAASKGNWEVSKYNLNGIVSKSFKDDKITVSMGGTFKAGNAWRSNDPRMEDFSHDLGVKLALHYQVNSKHTIGLSGGINSIAEENSNEYRNKDYQDNLQNMPYINFVNYGYGLNTIQNTNRQMNSFGDGVNMSVGYNGNFDLGMLTLTGGVERVKSTFLRKSSLSSNANYAYGKFDEQIKHADLLLTNAPSGNNLWSLKASVKEHYGTDFNTILNGNNFIYFTNEFSLRPIYGILKDARLKAEFSLFSSRSRMYKTDGNTDHRVDYKNTDLGVAGAWYHYGKTAGKYLRMNVSLTSRINNEADVHVPKTQENNFSKDVVYYDLYYMGSNSTTFGFGILYNFPIKNNLFFVKGDYQIQNAVLPNFSQIPSAFPGKRRENICLSLGFTL